MRLDRKTLVSVLSFVLAVAVAWLVADGGDQATAPTVTSASTESTATPVTDRTTAPSATSDETGATVGSSATVPDGFEAVTLDELPPEALDTIALIDDGGPYPYGADDEVFQNREGLLPDRSRGYYREYTVETPGSDDRGARRIVTGEDGEMYYTDDHYESFRWVVR